MTVSSHSIDGRATAHVSSVLAPVLPTTSAVTCEARLHRGSWTLATRETPQEPPSACCTHMSCRPSTQLYSPVASEEITNKTKQNKTKQNIANNTAPPKARAPPSNPPASTAPRILGGLFNVGAPISTTSASTPSRDASACRTLPPRRASDDDDDGATPDRPVRLTGDREPGDDAVGVPPSRPPAAGERAAVHDIGLAMGVPPARECAGEATAQGERGGCCCWRSR